MPRLVEIYSSRQLKTSLRESRWFVNCYYDYHHIVVAKMDGEIQGACFWRIEGEEYSGLGWIENLWVEVGFRKRGLGEHLLRKAIRDMETFFKHRRKRLRRVILTTQVERGSARRLYEKVGFRCNAKLGDAYEHGGMDLMYMLGIGQ